MLKIIAWVAGVFGGILLFLILLLILVLIPRVRIEVDKEPAKPLRLLLGYGILRIPILPRPKKTKKAPQAPEQPPRQAGRPREKRKPAFSIRDVDIGDAICLALDILIELRNRLVIHRLRANVLIATGDAAKTGILLGRAAAITGMILPVLEQNFVIRDFNINVDGDFQAEEASTRASAGVTLSFRPIHLPLILLKYIRPITALLKALRRGSKNAESTGPEEINPSIDAKKENVT